MTRTYDVSTASQNLAYVLVSDLFSDVEKRQAAWEIGRMIQHRAVNGQPIGCAEANALASLHTSFLK